MKVCDLNYGDCVIWRESELVVLRIEKDVAFLEEAMYKATEFFKYGILPELVAKWYTKSLYTQLQETHASITMSIHYRLPVQSSNIQDPHSSNTLTSTMETTEQKYCYCKKEKPGEMIGCDGDNCSIEWFHVDCLRKKRIPKKEWYCPDCRKEKSKLKNKST